ncbi:MAG: DUF4389 domain-containing protein [Longimicrobiales bacterium]|nr:DUF4389 domain-containing protein [Longimicrobiales bacterium]
MEHESERVESVSYPVSVHVEPQIEGRDRLTAFFRFFLALPHILLVGAPVAMATGVSYTTEGGGGLEYSSGGGLVSIVVFIASLIAWLAIVVTARHPDRLWRLSAWYLRWRVRAAAYITLLRDEYPPFGDGDYATPLELPEPQAPRSRLTAAFRIVLALPHLVLVGLLGVAWAFTTAVGWAFILFTGRYPKPLYGFALGALAWTVRVEAYVLLLRDEYPPFTLRT